MKKIFVLLIGLISIAFSGCSAAKPVNPVETASDPEKYGEVLKSDWSNFETIRFEAVYGEVGLHATGGTEALNKDNCHIENHTLSASLEYIFQIWGPVYTGEIRTTCFVLINDQLTDFCISGKKSRNGILAMDVPMTENMIEANFEVENGPWKTGENDIVFLAVGYYPQVGRYIQVSSHGTFTADENGTDSTIPMISVNDAGGTIIPAEPDQLTLHESIKNGLIAQQDVLGINENNGSMQIHSDSRMNFTVMNADGDKVYNQKGIVVVFQNGELIPAWGNEKFVSVVLSEKDAMAEIPFYANTAENEYAYIGAFYFNTYNQSEETLNHQNLIELFQIVS